jgi:pyruvate dehydrogenase E1 component
VSGRDAFDSVLEFDGPERAGFLLEELISEARRNGAPVPYSANTPYLNTIAPGQQPQHPGDGAIEHHIRSLIRWNAVAIVLRANKESSELGGHIASFQSAATLYDTGFNHFGTPRRTATVATWCSCRGTARRASTRARSWRAG